jgi:hypothetical protein
MFFQNVDGRVKWYRHPLRMALFATILLSAIALFVKPSKATIGVITKADLYGPWQAAIVGFTGCGQASALVNFTLNSTGTGTATLVSSGQCGAGTLTGQTFTINSLNADGSGTANLSCGPACGWNFNIQIAPDRSIFNLVDVTDPGNYFGGSAVHQ